MTIATWISFGVGGVGLASGTIAGVVALTKAHDLDSRNCRDNHCPSTVPQSDVNSLNTWRHISTACFVVGAIGTAAGISFFLTTPRKGASQSALLIGPLSMNLVGHFE